tara:strand:- start:157 stop:456 length:300 start_codon:yes stop_codon:yes gene_type:complete
MKRIFLIVFTLITKLTYSSFPIIAEPERSAWVGQIFGIILIVGGGSFFLYQIYRLFRYLLRVFLEKRGLLVSFLSFIAMLVIAIPILYVLAFFLAFALD